MDGARTRGHAPAVAAIEGMVRGGAPHAILLSGPGGVGKTTLAMDLAAGLLCVGPDLAARPCRACRGCRLLEHGDHPDLHRLAPAGPGGQIVIGGPDSKVRGVRDLISDLILMPLEGTARVAIIEAAHRMNPDAQAALLKTLEEPPAGLTLVLCTDDEDRLLPTVRSRCARIRLGPVGVRDIESILGEHGVADPPLAARLARLAAGRPGTAIAYARAPDAVRIRGELARILLDLLGQGPARRLVAMRDAMPQAMAMAAALEAGTAAAQASSDAAADATTRPPGRRASKATAAGAPASAAVPDEVAADAPGDEAAEAAEPGIEAVGGKTTIPPAARRRAAEILVSIWIDIARDLALAGSGGVRSVRDPDLIEELTAAAADLPDGAAAASLAGTERAATLLANNASPELVLDVLALAWPRRRRAA
jgi:DNA polymerase-3 subunit delta'